MQYTSKLKTKFDRPLEESSFLPKCTQAVSQKTRYVYRSGSQSSRTCGQVLQCQAMISDFPLKPIFIQSIWYLLYYIYRNIYFLWPIRPTFWLIHFPLLYALLVVKMHCKRFLQQNAVRVTGNRMAHVNLTAFSEL